MRVTSVISPHVFITYSDLLVYSTNSRNGSHSNLLENDVEVIDYLLL